MGRLKDKVVVITGGGSGIGEATARLSAKEGAKVVITGRTKEKLDKVVDSILEDGGEAYAIQQDVVNEGQWTEVFEQVIEKYGSVDVLVNNAGMSSPKTILELTTEEWDKIQKIDLDSVIYGMKHVLPIMIEQKSGSIINISSLAGITGMAGTSPYTAAKGALVTLSQAAAAEFGEHNIRVNTVHPGIIETPMTLEHMDNAIDFYKAHIQLPYIGTPKDIAYSIIFLASEEARYITGSKIVVDGGWTTV